MKCFRFWSGIFICLFMVFVITPDVFAHESATAKVAEKSGWQLSVEDYEKRWYYFSEAGVPGEGWLLDEGNWYYLVGGATKIGDYIMEYAGEMHHYTFDTDGRLIKDTVLTSGWIFVNDAWYYYNGERLLKNEWALIGGSWYAFDWTGRMYESELVYDYGSNGYFVVDSSGRWVKNQWVLNDYGQWFYTDAAGKAVVNGWILNNGVWYYFKDALMVAEPTVIGGQLNIFNKSGTWLGVNNMNTGWVAAYDSWYYLENGRCATGWKLVNGDWYYFDNNTYLAYRNNVYGIGGNNWLFNNNAALTSGWVLNGQGNWYYANSEGVVQTGWQLVGGTWYYFGSDGMMYSDGIYHIYEENKEHVFAKSGAWLGEVKDYADGWQYIGDNWYYFENEVAQSGVEKIDGQIYAFDDVSKKMIANGIWWVGMNDATRLGSSMYVLGFDANGGLATNQWLYVEELGKWMWFDKEGLSVKTGIIY